MGLCGWQHSTPPNREEGREGARHSKGFSLKQSAMQLCFGSASSNQERVTRSKVKALFTYFRSALAAIVEAEHHVFPTS